MKIGRELETGNVTEHHGFSQTLSKGVSGIEIHAGPWYSFVIWDSGVVGVPLTTNSPRKRGWMYKKEVQVAYLMRRFCGIADMQVLCRTVLPSESSSTSHTIAILPAYTYNFRPATNVGKVAIRDFSLATKRNAHEAVTRSTSSDAEEPHGS